MSNKSILDNFNTNNLVKNQISYSFVTTNGTVSNNPNILDINYSSPPTNICYSSASPGPTNKIIYPGSSTECTPLSSTLLSVSVMPNPDTSMAYITASIFDNNNNKLDITNIDNYQKSTYLIITYNPPIAKDTSTWVIILIVIPSIIVIGGIIWYFFIRKKSESPNIPIKSLELKGGIFHMGE